MNSNFFIDTKGLASIRIDLQNISKQIPGATRSAVNRTLSFTTTQTGREVTNEYTVAKKDVNSTLTKHRASGSSFSAWIDSKGKSIPLEKFKHRPSKYSKRIKKVQVKIKKSSGYKVLHTSPGAFVQTIYGGSPGIYKRKGKNKMPVLKLRTLSIPQMIANPKIINKIQDASAKKLQERVDHEIKWRLEKASRRSE